MKTKTTSEHCSGTYKTRKQNKTLHYKAKQTKTYIVKHVNSQYKTRKQKQTNEVVRQKQ